MRNRIWRLTGLVGSTLILILLSACTAEPTPVVQPPTLQPTTLAGLLPTVPPPTQVVVIPTVPAGIARPPCSGAAFAPPSMPAADLNRISQLN